jgi:hypothetical protein
VDGELQLFFDANAGAGGSGGAGGATTSGYRRVRIHGIGAMPVFPLGAKVWLAKSQDLDRVHLGSPEPPHAFSIRSRQGGPLLLGEAYNAFTDAASPVEISTVSAICSYVSSADSCTPGATISYSSLTVVGDAPVVVRPGEPGAITLQGQAYDVRANAIATGAFSGPTTCADSPPANYVSLDIRARQLDNLVAGLEVGPLPACRNGNEPDHHLNIGGSFTTMYEGVVSYKGRDASVPGSYLFDIPGIAPVAGRPPPELHIDGAADLLPEPAVGQSFWFSYRFGVQVLRETQNGPLVLAYVHGSVHAGAPTPVGVHLGISVGAEEACSYTDTVKLWEVVFFTTPAVRVPSGTIGAFTTGGRNYRVWVRADTSFAMTIFPGN